MTHASSRAEGLGKRYGRRWALRDCSFDIPAGRVVALVGPNGAGKTTLLHLAVGLLQATTGSIELLGERPAAGPEQLARVGFVAQDAPDVRGALGRRPPPHGRVAQPGLGPEPADGASSGSRLDPRQRAGSSRAGSARSSR